jgi:nucleotide-binding universal stress UspA family protein
MIGSEATAAARLELLSDALCGVDGTRAAYEAVRQAASLAGPDGHLTLLAVTDVRGSGTFETALLAPAVARRALDHARRLARLAGVPSQREVEPTGRAFEGLLTRARQHTLLALGAPSMSRLAHILVGGVATEAAHKLPSAVLIARRPPAGTRFGERIMVASDVLKHSDPLVDFATDPSHARQPIT